MLIDSVSQTQLRQTGDGISLFFDLSRSKWVSGSRYQSTFSIDHKSVSHSQWMDFHDVPSNINGDIIARNALIVSTTVRCRNNATGTFKIRRNGDLTSLVEVSLSSEGIKVVNDLDIELDASDFLQVFLDNIVGSVDYPVIQVEVAYR